MVCIEVQPDGLECRLNEMVWYGGSSTWFGMVVQAHGLVWRFRQNS